MKPTAPRRLVVGRVIRAHGIRGEAVVEELSDAPDRFAAGARLGIGDPEGEPPTVTIASARRHQGRLLVRFREIADRSAVESLRGALLSIPTSEAMVPPPGAYYPHQIEGLEVVDEAGARLGTLAEVRRGRAHDVWVVDAGHEVLVPAVSEVVLRVDLDAGRVVLRPPPGLFDEDTA